MSPLSSPWKQTPFDSHCCTKEKETPSSGSCPPHLYETWHFQSSTSCAKHEHSIPQPVKGYSPYIFISSWAHCFQVTAAKGKGQVAAVSKKLPASLFRLELPLNVSSHLLPNAGVSVCFSLLLCGCLTDSVAGAARHGLMLSMPGDSLVSEVSVLAGLTQPFIFWQQIEIK